MIKVLNDNAIKSAIKDNANWLTITAVALIFVVGITIVNNPANWWVSAIAVLGFSVVIFTVINGRVVLKAAFSIIALAISVSAAASLAPFLSNDPFFSSTWPLYILSAYFLSLALSYLLYSGAGRWLYLIFSTIFGFLSTFILVSLGAQAQLSAIISAIMSTGLYVALYKLNRKTRNRFKMPKNGFSKELYNALNNGAKKLNMEIRLVEGNKTIGPHFIIYGKRSYILYPIIMDQAFGVTGRLGRHLSYHGKTINYWLSKIAFMSSVTWKAKGANPPLALIDLSRKNGSDSKVIGVSLPDSKKKAVVGVAAAPAKSMNRETYGSDLIVEVIELMKDYSDELTEKQKESLGNIGYTIDDFIVESDDDEVNKKVK